MPIRKILVVDDSPTERLSLSELLTGRGFEVSFAVNGDEAIHKAQNELPDLILMDVVMPGTSGFAATRQIAKSEATRNIPVIMCTSKSQETDRIWGMRQGAFAYLTKPLDHQQLLAKIAMLG
jgi:twitching motility two-component system response regulator PilH